MEHERLNRRTILKASAATAAGGLAGCLGGSNGGSFNPADAQEFPVPDIEQKFNLWNWYDGLSSYAANNMPKQYENLNTVTTTGYASSSEWFSKLKAGNHSIDAIASTTTYTDMCIANDLISPLPTDNMPNYSNALKLGRDQMKKHFSDDEGNVYAHPHVIGLWPCLGYNSNEFSNKPMSWDVLWNEEYKGKLTMQDQPIVSGFIGAMYTGQDFANPDDFKDIEEALIQQKELCKTYWKEYETGMQLFVNETVVAGANTMGRLFSAHFQNNAPYVNYSVPKEGALYYLDSSIIPSDAPHPRVATEYLNWYLDPQNAIKMFTEMGYLPAIGNIDDAMKEADVPKEQRDFVTWSDKQRDRFVFWEPLDDKVRQEYNDLWTRVKAA